MYENKSEKKFSCLRIKQNLQGLILFFQKKCKESTSKLGHLYRCTGCETMTVQPLGKLIKDEKNNIKYVLPKGPPVDQKCKFCQHPHLIGGAY